MAPKQLPFLTTKVSERTSMAAIQDLLESVGFEQTGQLTQRDGRRVVMAMQGKATFHFEVDPKRVENAVIAQMSNRKRKKMQDVEDWEAEEIRKEVQEQAIRIGWRLMHEKVKATVDSIRLNVETIAEAFGSHMLLPGPDGPIKVADALTKGMADGSITSPGFLNRLLLLPPKK